ncbi:MAG: TonB-dependent receptor [Bacteroidetes bacterium]|nr:TonB-dependent receptor [Bacteroidota bacterium]
MEKIINYQKTLKSVSGVSLFFIAGLMSLQLNGQLSFQNDTLKIQEVVITRKQISSEQPGFKFYRIDSLRLNDYPLFSLTEVLNETTPLFIKYYGSGGTATSSFRGTSAGHTQVTWNGININDPMLGQSDFSLLPSGMIDNVMISFGGASMDLGNGAIGGIINLENEPYWKKQTLIVAVPGAGSFGRYSGLVKVSTGSDHFQSVTKGYLNSSRNDFPYLDTEAIPEPLWKKRENNQILQKGFMQELYLRKSENVLSARFWYQSASRDLPGSTQYGYSGEKQSDESLRSLVSYDIVKGKKEYFSTAAWIFTNLNYTSQLYSIDSRNKANTLVLKGGMTTPLGEYSHLKIVLSDELNAIESNNYNESVRHNNASVTLSAERKKGKRFGAVILVRETLDDKLFLVPDFSAGFEFRVIRGEEHFLKLNSSRNSRIPSMNDCFWNPGGNPDLKNEYAYSYEIGYKLDHQISQSVTLSSELDYYNNYIRDMIQWRPGESYFWVADNIGSVNSSGFESSLSVKYLLNNLSVNLNVGYSYTRAREINNGASETAGKQLIYIPENQANSSLHVAYKNFYTTLVTNFTGRTYTTADNSGFLQGYTINNFTSGMKFNFKKNFIDLRFKIENIFDTSYKTIAYYPQPGRTYFLILSLHLKK